MYHHWFMSFQVLVHQKQFILLQCTKYLHLIAPGDHFLIRKLKHEWQQDAECMQSFFYGWIVLFAKYATINILSARTFSYMSIQTDCRVLRVLQFGILSIHWNISVNWQADDTRNVLSQLLKVYFLISEMCSLIISSQPAWKR